MKYSKKEDFLHELQKISFTAKEDFIKQIHFILDNTLEKFHQHIQQELQHIIKHIRNRNFENLQNNLLGMNLIKKGHINIDQILKKISYTILDIP